MFFFFKGKSRYLIVHRFLSDLRKMYIFLTRLIVQNDINLWQGTLEIFPQKNKDEEMQST